MLGPRRVSTRGQRRWPRNRGEPGADGREAGGRPGLVPGSGRREASGSRRGRGAQAAASGFVWTCSGRTTM